MNKIKLIGVCLTLAGILIKGNVAAQQEKLKEGDLIFQSSNSSQAKAIEKATHSKFSHCGIIFKDGDRFVVLEAVQPVTKTPLEEWIADGRNGKYEVRRLKNSSQVLSPQVIMKMKETGESYIGKNYDSNFSWSDDNLYCSELVWKIYDRAAGIDLGTPKKLSSYNLEDPLVRKAIKERYGKDVPLDEPMISPGDVYGSELLFTVSKK